MASPAYQLTYILQDIFNSYPSLTASTLCLTERTLFVRILKNGKVEQNDINISDVIGCQSVVRKIKNGSKDCSSYLRICYYPLRSVGNFLSKQSRRERQIVKFGMRKFDTYEENAAAVKKWQCVILWLIRGRTFGANGALQIPELLPPPLKLLIIVNPHSGPGRASDIFKEQVVPVLLDSNVEYEVLITDRANCARDYVKSIDLSKWNGIVAVSGDGLLFEIFNGLMEREDWDVAVKIPVGIVPGGSGNGLARAINHAAGEPYDTTYVISSVLNIVRGRVSPMDLVEVQTTTVPVYSFLSIGWGLMADIDIESEKLRAIGEARFTLWAVIRALGLRKYKGRLSYLPVHGYESKCCDNAVVDSKVRRSETMNPELANGHGDVNKKFITPFRSKSFIRDKSEVPTCDSDGVVELLRFTLSDKYNSPKSDEYDSPKISVPQNVSTRKVTTKSEFFKSFSTDSVSSEDICDSVNQTGTGEISDMDVSMLQSSASNSNFSVSPLSEPVPNDWIVVEGEFVLVYVCHQTHISTDIMLAPNAKLDDGIMWLVMIKSDISRVQVIHFLSSLHTGGHVHIPCVDMIPIYAFRLEPFQTDDLLTVDGEVIPCGAIQAVVLPSMARIMTR